MINETFAKWALGFSGCHGGNIGSVDNKSIWYCGIEWGGEWEEKELNGIFSDDVLQPPLGYEDYTDGNKQSHEAWETNVAWQFNWQTMKILSVIAGKELAEYKSFAREFQPFVKNSNTNYFKMNLYPLAFPSTVHSLCWSEGLSRATGFQNDNEYIDWIRKNRFPVMRNWVREYSPKLILCTGVSYFEDFKKAFIISDTNINEEIIDNKQLKWFINENKTLVVVIPFMTNRHGLIKNVSISKFGTRIAELLETL